MSKTIDNGMPCAGEQQVVVVEKVYEEVKKEFLERGAYLLNPEDAEKLGKLMFPINPKSGIC